MENDLFNDILNDFKSLPQYKIQIGVIADNANRKGLNNKGITNAELMFIHENGSPLNNVPARPVLDMTINYAENNLLNKTIDKALKQFVNSGFKKEELKKELDKTAIRMENYARQIIYANDGRLIPNSPNVAKAKGGNHPLFNTGQLARSITAKTIES